MFGALIDGLTNIIGPAASKVVVPAVEGAGMGALTGLFTGKDPLKQALVGGVTGGAIGGFGGSDGALANYFGLSGPQANALIGGTVGGLGNYALGLDPLTGAGLGALGGYGYGLQTAPNTSLPATAENPDNQGVLDQLRAADAAGGGGGSSAAASETAAGRGGGALGASGAGAAKGINATTLALGALAALGSSQKPKQATWQTPGQSSVAGNLGPLWNAPMTSGGPGRTPTNVFAGGSAPGYWTYGGPERTYFNNNSTRAFGFAQGGAMEAGGGGANDDVGPGRPFSTANGEHYVQGPGDGQADEVPARLADGEYVFDATTVARLGNGSNRRGAQRLDQMRRAIAHDAGSDRVVQKRITQHPLQYAYGGQ